MPRKASNRAQRRCAAPHSGLKFRIGRGPENVIHHSELDDVVWATLREQAEATIEPVCVSVFGLNEFQDKARWALFNFIRDLDGRCDVRIDGQRCSDMFAAVLSTMAGPGDLKAHSRSIRASVEAAALFHADVPGAAAARINGQLKKINAAKINLKTLEKQIRQIAGHQNTPRDDEILMDAHAAAERFHNHLRAALAENTACQSAIGSRESDESHLVLAYHASTFYQWTGRIWNSINDDCLAAQITRFLQAERTPRLGGRFVQDVFANLKAIALLDGWDEQPPFFIQSRRPFAVTRPMRIVFSNGVIELDATMETGEAPVLANHDSSFFNTIALPFDFDPGALCPRWTEFLNQVLPPTRPEDHRQEVLQEFVGYTLVRDCRFEKMLAMIGNGHNGKSTILKVLEELFGRQNVTNVPFNEICAEYRLHDIARAAANFSSEMNHMGRSDEGLLKQLISGEPVTANRKYKDQVKVRPSAKLYLAANDLPNISDTSEGMWRRLLLIPFDVSIPLSSINRSLAEELKAELPGIFNWALVGLRRLLAQNRFTYCQRCESFLREHRIESDSVAEFIRECCCRATGWQSHSQRLFELYRYFTTMNQRKAVMSNEFGKRMNRLSIQKRRVTSPDDSRHYVFANLRVSSANGWEARYIHEKQPGWVHISSTTNGGSPP